MASSSVKKLLFFFIPFVAISIFMIVSVLLSDADITIRSYHADITLNASGDMHVVETWDMHYNGDYNVRFRDIGFDKYPDDYPLVSSAVNRASFDEDNVLVSVIKN